MGARKDSLEGLRAEVAVSTRARTLNEARRRGPERARREALRALEAQLARLPPRPHAPACAAGCALCCHLRVAATPAEVFGLIDHLRSSLTGAGWQALGERVRDTAAAVHALSPQRLLTTNLPCPVLVAGRCSGYAGRPLNCRAYHSLDLAACEHSFAHPGDLGLGHPQDAAVARVNEGVQRGFIDGLGEAGLDVAQYELATALAEALEDPAARERYAAGGTAFTRALRL
jgi:hypothetical protein